MRFKGPFILFVFMLLGLGCGSSKNVNFLGVQEAPKKTAPAPSNPSLGTAQNAAKMIDVEEEEEVPKYLRKYQEDQNYTASLEEFQAMLQENPENPELNFLVAESFRKLGQVEASAPYYEKALSGGYANDEIPFHYMLALKANERYDQAKDLMQAVVQETNSELYRERAQEQLNNLNKLDSIRLQVRDVELNPLEVINSEFADYSPSFFRGELYFVSHREEAIFNRYDQPFSDIFKVKLEGLSPQENTVERLPDIFNDPGINEGAIAFAPDGNSVVFAKGNPGGAKDRRSVDLYFAVKRNGNWTNPVVMPISSPGAWDSTPVFNREGSVLYFASDRPGGYGGSDLYRATLNERGRWADVVNLGPEINTPLDEMFPYVSPDNKLYFASDGHAGFGMLDLFEATNQGGIITIQNMGPSYNSSADDFALVYTDFPFEGFFSSNRKGGQGSDDIYSFIDNSSDLKQITYVLKGTTYQLNDDSTQTILGDVRVTLLDANEAVVDDVLSSRSGSYSFEISPEKAYFIMAERPQYFTARKPFSTVGEGIPQEDLMERFTEKVFVEDLSLGQIVLEKTIVIPNIYYDLDRAEIRSDAAQELDKLVQLLEDNPSIKIELSSHTDARSEDNYNLELSQRRAQAAVDYVVSKGISADRLLAKGYGESQLVNGCTNNVPCTEEQHQENRRTEFKVIAIGEE